MKNKHDVLSLCLYIYKISVYIWYIEIIETTNTAKPKLIKQNTQNLWASTFFSYVCFGPWCLCRWISWPEGGTSQYNMAWLSYYSYSCSKCIHKQIKQVNLVKINKKQSPKSIFFVLAGIKHQKWGGLWHCFNHIAVSMRILLQPYLPLQILAAVKRQPKSPSAAELKKWSRPAWNERQHRGKATAAKHGRRDWLWLVGVDGLPKRWHHCIHWLTQDNVIWGMRSSECGSFKSMLESDNRMYIQIQNSWHSGLTATLLNDCAHTDRYICTYICMVYMFFGYVYITYTFLLI